MIKKLINSSLISVLAAASSVNALGPDVKTMGFGNGNAVGAAYFMTNEPTGNYIVAADIGSNGKLSLRSATSTEGVGSHGNNGGNFTTTDPLFSQGSVSTSSTAKVLAAVNSGSNTISLFGIDSKNPSSLHMIGKPIGTGGEFPMSLAFNSKGTSLCVVNGGEVNSVACFKVDKSTGLSPISKTRRSLNLNQTTPASGPPNSIGQIAFSEDDKSLIVTVKGNPGTTPVTTGYIAVFSVASDGSLSSDSKNIFAPSGGVLPFSLTNIPGKNAVLATDPAIGYEIYDLSGGPTASTKNYAAPVPGQKAICWSTYSKKTGNIYLIDAGASLVSEISISNNLNGTLVKQYQQAQGSGTLDGAVASVGKNDYLYVLGAGKSVIDVLALNGPGKANNYQTLDFATPAKHAGLKVSFNVQGMAVFAN